MQGGVERYQGKERLVRKPSIREAENFGGGSAGMSGKKKSYYQKEKEPESGKIRKIEITQGRGSEEGKL